MFWLVAKRQVRGIGIGKNTEATCFSGPLVIVLLTSTSLLRDPYDYDHGFGLQVSVQAVKAFGRLDSFTVYRFVHQ